MAREWDKRNIRPITEDDLKVDIDQYPLRIPPTLSGGKNGTPKKKKPELEGY